MDMTLGSIIKEKGGALFSVSPDATVSDAVKVMVDGGVGSVIVLDHGHIKGLFTERDLLRRVVYADKDPATTPIAKVMTADVATVSPDLTVSEAMSLCTEKRIRRLPVVEGDVLLGVVSSGDLTKWAVHDQQHTIDDLTKYIYGEPA
ncbi:CBS domain-containing protein [Natronocella acetinitrilica]|uniref:CBS domain-containing protein n=1 Tax=Natronocella acetinitrilica TaxID=414046 RepID=A0AAE3G500_9GAMM|nr:CBS domain-containing protein [Natronocella acetinitrilica]MCP1675248.1 CBS domain-containing protein [Natronocella acetinitrilica]